MGSQHPDHGIGDSGSQSSADSDQRRDKGRVLEARFDHKEAADERQHYAGRLYGRDFFLQDQEGENNREEGGQFVQDRGVRYQKMVYGVIIAEYADGPEDAPHGKGRPVTAVDPGRYVVFHQDRRRECRRHQVAEEAFLHGRQISRQADAYVHAGKEEG